MPTPNIAKVVIDSALPQLDRLFDYLIPEGMPAAVGCRVEVPFGKSKKLMPGYIVEIGAESEFDKLASIENLISEAQVLSEDTYKLCRQVANRQTVSISDVLRLAIPKRAVAVEKKWLVAKDSVQAEISSEVSNAGPARKFAKLVQPLTTQDGQVWSAEIVELVAAKVSAGKSSIVVLPDRKDLEALIDALEKSGLGSQIVNYDSQQTGSVRYQEFLRCLGSEPLIVVGNRSAIFAPLHNLGLICIWSDGDSSLQEPASPYIHVREIALIRQQIANCDLALLSHTRSCEVQRLIEIGYIDEISAEFAGPNLSISPSDVRIDGGAWSIVRSALRTGPVLIQVANKGQSASAYCARCGKRATCRNCSGPIWVDSSSIPKCRWCNALNLHFSCDDCQSSALKQGRPGSAKTIADFGRAFPNVRIIEATAETKNNELGAGSFIVISTPGAEPQVSGGYAAVIILDAGSMLAADSLRAEEDAVRKWADALALAGYASTNSIVGLSGQLANNLQVWNQAEIARRALSERRSLRFPPAIRIATVSAENKVLSDLSDELSDSTILECFGPVPVMHNGRQIEAKLLIKFEYSRGHEVSELLRSLILRLSAGAARFNASSGRPMRPIRVKMDDPEVI